MKPWLGVVDLALDGMKKKEMLHTATGATQEAVALEGRCHAAASHNDFWRFEHCRWPASTADTG